MASVQCRSLCRRGKRKNAEAQRGRAATKKADDRGSPEDTDNRQHLSRHLGGAEKNERIAARPKSPATARSGPDWRFLTASSEGGASRRKISVDLNCHGALVPFGGFPSSSLRERG